MWAYCFLLISARFASVKAQKNCQIADNTDPCKRFNTRDIPYLDTRHPDIPFSDDTSNDKMFCDLHALTDGVWYVSDYPMTTHCVQPDSCGSRLPIWLNGSLPDLNAGIINRLACMRNTEECCRNSYNLQLKNCSFYYVYCFVDLPNGCPQRYCFDIDRTKFITTTTTSTTTATTVVTTTNKTNNEGSAASERQKSDSGVVVALALVIAVSVTAILALSGIIVLLKKKLTSNVVPQKC